MYPFYLTHFVNPCIPNMVQKNNLSSEKMLKIKFYVNFNLKDAIIVRLQKLTQSD